jgi:hypothetical protein
VYQERVSSPFGQGNRDGNRHLAVECRLGVKLVEAIPRPGGPCFALTPYDRACFFDHAPSRSYSNRRARVLSRRLPARERSLRRRFFPLNAGKKPAKKAIGDHSNRVIAPGSREVAPPYPKGGAFFVLGSVSGDCARLEPLPDGSDRVAVASALTIAAAGC